VKRNSLFQSHDNRGDDKLSSVAEGSNFKEFGIQGYRAPKLTTYHITNIAALKTQKIKNTSFVDDYIKVKSFVPSPEKYQKPKIWCSKDEDGRVRAKGAFLKNPRTTFTGETINY